MCFITRWADSNVMWAESGKQSQERKQGHGDGCAWRCPLTSLVSCSSLSLQLWLNVHCGPSEQVSRTLASFLANGNNSASYGTCISKSTRRQYINILEQFCLKQPFKSRVISSFIILIKIFTTFIYYRGVHATVHMGEARGTTYGSQFSP